MEHSVEATGNTVEEAKQNALQMLGGVEEHQVQFEILDEGKKGLFGLVGSPARVRATLLESTETTPEELPPSQEYRLDEPTVVQVLQYVQQVLEVSPFQVQAVQREVHGHYCEIELIGRDVAYLIGKNGEAIDSLQYLLNRMIAKQIHPQVRVVLDGGGYRKRRAERLRNQAMVIALEVKQRGEEAVLPPMPAHERRVIHQALKEDPDVMTYSEGDEPNRRVVISPRKT